jgi:hypothetical protein
VKACSRRSEGFDLSYRRGRFAWGAANVAFMAVSARPNSDTGQIAKVTRPGGIGLPQIDQGEHRSRARRAWTKMFQPSNHRITIPDDACRQYSRRKQPPSCYRVHSS